MRKASDVYEGYVQYEYTEISESAKKSILSAMKQYAKEALQEAADRVKIVRYQPNPFQSRESALANQQRDYIDKESILNLINELK